MDKYGTFLFPICLSKIHTRPITSLPAESQEALEQQVLELQGMLQGQMGTEEALMTGGAAERGPCCDNIPLLAALLWAGLHYVKLMKL